jgi:hypothetical protein
VDSLTPEEKARIGMQADMLIRVLADRYGLEPTEVAEAVRWVQTHREFVAKLKHSSMLSLVGIVIGGALLAMWEGAKAFLRGDR